MGAPVDVRSLAEAFSHEGIDPRIWVSNATVDDSDSVVFDDDFGPLVGVTLQPSKLPAYCRVAGFVAGNGEAVYHPFVAGDEVLVVMPGGTVRSNPIIVAKLNQSTDAWPKGSIGGQDPTTNTFGFIRSRAPFVIESAGMLMLSQATTNAFITIDQKGTITLKDGAKDALQIGADVFGFQSADAKMLLQLDLTSKRLTLQVDDALIVLSSSGASPPKNAISTPGSLTISTGTSAAVEHVATTESTANVLVALLAAMKTLVSAFAIGAPIPAPSPGGNLAPLIAPLIEAAFDSVALALAYAQANGSQLDATVAAAIIATFGSAQPKQAGVPGSGQMFPGIGCSALLAG